MKQNKMKIEIWSDITCHFCYTAKRKLEAALTQFKDKAHIEIIWKSFEVAPGLKTDANKNLPLFLAELKGISAEQARGMTAYVENTAKEVGLLFDLERAIPANSFKAHQISHLAKHYGLQGKAEELLFKAYFSEGKNIDDMPTLIQIGIETGLEAAEVKTVLALNEYAEEVKQDIYEAELAGVTSVPHFLFNKQLAVSGAQESSALLEILETTFTGWQKENLTLDPVFVNGPSCKIGEDCK